MEAIREIVGSEPRVEPSRFAGMVDPQICKTLLTELKLNDEQVAFFMPRVLARIREVYPRMQKKLVLNVGVRDLLEVLATCPEHVSGVLTGNLATVAETKLIYTGIRGYLSELFCSDDYLDRTSLVENSVRTCMARYKLNEGSDVMIVGDTPRDIEAANASHATSIGVASGIFTLADLAQAGARQVYRNLKPTKELLEGLAVKRAQSG